MIRAVLAFVYACCLLGARGDGAGRRGDASLGAADRVEETAGPQADGVRQVTNGGAGRISRAAAGSFTIPWFPPLAPPGAVTTAAVIRPDRPAPILSWRAPRGSRAPPVRPSL